MKMYEDAGGDETQIVLLVLQGSSFEENMIAFGSGIEIYG